MISKADETCQSNQTFLSLYVHRIIFCNRKEVTDGRNNSHGPSENVKKKCAKEIRSDMLPHRGVASAEGSDGEDDGEDDGASGRRTTGSLRFLRNSISTRYRGLPIVSLPPSSPLPFVQCRLQIRGQAAAPLACRRVIISSTDAIYEAIALIRCTRGTTTHLRNLQR